ncbi:TatD family hydrolase [Streptomyces sp. NPDC021225]|uniref:TatD family hydrolase n=1 Tax=Streptomyces sp. NPDC021225 TaxID=3365121 RepID=UPI0037A64886
MAQNTTTPGGNATKNSAQSAQKEKDAPPPLPEPLRVPVADSHTHLDMQSGTVEEALAKAASVGVTTLIQVGCDLAGSRWAAETAEAHENVWATVALHPNEAPRIVHGTPPSGGQAPQAPRDGRSRQGAREPGGEAALDAALEEIAALAALPQVRGVGETGLDYFRTGPEGIAAQERSFRGHIAIAKRYGKALVIHDREAHEDVLRVLAEEGPPETVVFHCYSGDAAMAKICAAHGYYMSFAGNVTFKNATPLRKALAVAPLDLLLVETDAPFLTPAPYRGRPNAPYLIPLTLRAMAEVKGVTEDTLAAAVAANTARVFGYRAPVSGAGEPGEGRHVQ